MKAATPKFSPGDKVRINLVRSVYEDRVPQDTLGTIAETVVPHPMYKVYVGMDYNTTDGYVFALAEELTLIPITTYPSYPGVVCKGSALLGTNCGHCARCKDIAEVMHTGSTSKAPPNEITALREQLATVTKQSQALVAELLKSKKEFEDYKNSPCRCNNCVRPPPPCVDCGHLPALVHSLVEQKRLYAQQNTVLLTEKESGQWDANQTLLTELCDLRQQERVSRELYDSLCEYVGQFQGLESAVRTVLPKQCTDHTPGNCPSRDQQLWYPIRVILNALEASETEDE